MTVWTGPPLTYNGAGSPDAATGRFEGRPVMFSGSGYLPPDPRQTMPPVSGGPVQMMPDGRTGFSDMMGRVQSRDQGPTLAAYGGGAMPDMQDMASQIAAAARDPMAAERLRGLVSSVRSRLGSAAAPDPPLVSSTPSQPASRWTMPPQPVEARPSIQSTPGGTGRAVYGHGSVEGAAAPRNRYRESLKGWSNRRQNDRKERFNSDTSADSIEKKLVDQSPSQPGNVSNWRDRVQQMRGGRGWGRGGRVGVGQGLARGNPNPKSWSERLAMR